MVESTSRSVHAVYTVGKIHSKYLILEFFGFAGTTQFVKQILLSSSYSLRKLVVRNYKLLDIIITGGSILTVENLSQLLQHKILLNSKLDV